MRGTQVGKHWLRLLEVFIKWRSELIKEIFICLHPVTINKVSLTNSIGPYYLVTFKLCKFTMSDMHARCTIPNYTVS